MLKQLLGRMLGGYLGFKIPIYYCVQSDLVQKTLWGHANLCYIAQYDHRERDQDFYHQNYDFMGQAVTTRRRVDRINHFLQIHHEIRDAWTHQQLKIVV
jgi:hypothetical protein